MLNINNDTDAVYDMKVDDNAISSNQSFVFNPYKNSSYNPITSPIPNPKVPYNLGDSNLINKPAWEAINGKNGKIGIFGIFWAMLKMLKNLIFRGANNAKNAKKTKRKPKGN